MSLQPVGTRHKWSCILLGALLGAAAFFAVNTAAPLTFTDDGWILAGYVEKDILQHYVGWNFYRRSPLGFPLGIIPAINYPAGTAITYMDAVPLLAIPLRLAEGLLPEVFQYFGLYTLICYTLQGAAAGALLSLFCDKLVQVLPGCCLFIFAPIMVERALRHTALASHWLILFALYLYFVNQKSAWRYRGAWPVLLCLATAIHPYFLPMLFAVLFADLVQRAVSARRVWGPVLFLGGCFAAVFVTGWCIGAFSAVSGGAFADQGYGHYCMNLNALINPVSCGGVVWSRLLPQRPSGLGSYEGFNYLGLGLLAALPVSAVLCALRRKRAGLAALLRGHWCLAAVCLCLSAFAVSTTLVWGGKVLLRIRLPEALLRLCGIFRSSGRMFYPVWYLLALFCVVTLARHWNARRWGTYLGAAALMLVLALQLWDISPALAAKRQHFVSYTQQGAEANPADSDFWAAAADDFEHLYSLDEILAQPLYPALWAAQNGMTTNDGFASRADVSARGEDIRKVSEDMLAGRIAPGTLYITSDRRTFYPLAEALGDAAVSARVDGIWYVLYAAGSGPEPASVQQDFTLYADLPLVVEDYTDGLWTRGVLNSDPSVCAILDYPVTQQYLDDAKYLVADGVSYAILHKDYSDPGWVMLTLDVEDASVLVDKLLTVK